MGKRKLNPRAAFSGAVPDVWQYFVMWRVELAVVHWFGQIDSDLHKGIQVAVRDEVICFEERFNLKKEKDIGVSCIPLCIP